MRSFVETIDCSLCFGSSRLENCSWHYHFGGLQVRVYNIYIKLSCSDEMREVGDIYEVSTYELKTTLTDSQLRNA